MLSGDTMYVDTGSFQLTQTIVLPSKITLRGKGMDSTTILGDTTFYDMFKPGDSTYVEDIYFRGNKCFRGLSKYAYEGLWNWWVNRCRFSQFSSESILCDETGYLQITLCRFEDWGGWGGAFSVRDAGDCRITNCTFYDPSGRLPLGDFTFNTNSQIVFDSNVVVGCGGPAIAGVVGGGGFIMKYNLFYGKSGLFGVVGGRGDLDIQFNSFYVDVPSQFIPDVTVIFVHGYGLRHCFIYNNIVAGANVRVVLPDEIPDTADVRVAYNDFYSTVQTDRWLVGLVSGSGPLDSVNSNVFADPMYVDPDNGDLRLQKGSPCIDAGAPWILDQDGTRSDIGALGGPGGSVYLYQDLPPKAPAKFTAGPREGRVILGWERASESDFRNYVLFRAVEPNAPLDSQQVFAYLDRSGRTTDDIRKNMLPFEDGGKELDLEQYIPKYALRDSRRSYFVDWHPIDTATSYYTLVAVDSSGLVSDAGVVQVNPPQAVGHPVIEDSAENTVSVGVPDSAYLEPNYPNPFNATTALVYNLPALGAQPAPVHIEIFNTLGQKVKTLVDERQSSGRHTAYWNGDDDYGRSLSSGIYFCRLEVSGIEFVKSGKMIILK